MVGPTTAAAPAAANPAPPGAVNPRLLEVRARAHEIQDRLDQLDRERATAHNRAKFGLAILLAGPATALGGTLLSTVHPVVGGAVAVAGLGGMLLGMIVATRNSHRAIRAALDGLELALELVTLRMEEQAMQAQAEQEARESAERLARKLEEVEQVAEKVSSPPPAAPIVIQDDAVSIGDVTVPRNLTHAEAERVSRHLPG